MCFFYDWLRSRSNPHLKFLHVLSWLGSSFLFSTEGFSIAWQCHRVEVQAPGMASTDTSGWAPSLTPPARSPPLQHCHGDPGSLVPARRGRQPRLPSWPAESGARARHVYRVFGSAGFCLTFPVSLARPFPGPKNRICYFYKTIFKLFIKYLVFIRFQSVRFHSQCCGIHHTLLNNR